MIVIVEENCLIDDREYGRSPMVWVNVDRQLHAHYTIQIIVGTYVDHNILEKFPSG